MPTPALYQQAPGGPVKLFERTVPERRRAAIEQFYVTDRAPEIGPDSDLPYGQRRLESIAFGTAVIEMQPVLTWDQLVEQSRLLKRDPEMLLRLGKVTELGRFPLEPYDAELVYGVVVHTPPVLRAHNKARRDFQRLLQRQLHRSPSGEVVLSVHGFNETYETAAGTAAELCPFFGREHACGIFTWPASSRGNFLLSYTSTTESAAFAVGHLANTIRMIAQTPGVERVNLLAHSRGTAVLLGALRELAIESNAAGIEPADALMVRHVVMMAPDTDLDLASQQMLVVNSNPDMLTRWPHTHMARYLSGRWTFYRSPRDKALGVSCFLFRSRRRVGQIDIDLLREADSNAMYRDWGKLAVIVHRGKRTDPFGHAYFLSNPEVSSNLIQLIRYETKPGEPGRSLKPVSSIAWKFPNAQ
jgi:esterase/lipase superfamily enzyme